MKLTHSPYYYNLEKLALVEFLEKSHKVIFYFPIAYQKIVTVTELFIEDGFSNLRQDIQSQLEEAGFIKINNLFFNQNKILSFCYQKGGINFILDNGKEYSIDRIEVENFHELFD